jgi:prepilin-type N-terminal cleavage/methylation domain-containing protein
MQRIQESRDASRQGFTLMELMVVIFVLSVVLALVMPAFSTRKGRLKEEARKVDSILRYTNETAAMKKQTLGLKFEFEEGVVSWDGPEGSKTERLRGLRGVELQTRGMVREGELIVLFGPTGLGEHLWVHLAEAEEEMTVSFNPISGRVKVF